MLNGYHIINPFTHYDSIHIKTELSTSKLLTQITSKIEGLKIQARPIT